MADLSITPIAEGVTADAAFEALMNMGTDGAFWLDGGDALPSYIGVGDRVELGQPVLSGLRRASERLREADSTVLGLVGWLSYDLGTEAIGVELGRVDGMPTSFVEVREALAIDPNGTVSLITRHRSPRELRERIRVLRARLRRPRCSSRSVAESTVADIRWHDTDREYAAKILRCQEHIRAGDAYQLCLTTRVTVHAQTEPLSVYRRLRHTNGTSRSGIIRIADTWMLSTSPEQFLAVDGQRVISTSPIKGTRPRSDDPVEDERLRVELRGNVKERAENIMIVDLMRNDLSRVCDSGTVTVTRLLEVESHPQVHQLVSTIEGRLREDIDAIDALAACFPAGSMTGAPKRRAMELLERIECGPRGLYAGAFGYLRFDGVADFAMTIRTIVCTPGGAVIGTGGGITVLSIPEEEVEEIHLKARALLAAISGASSGPQVESSSAIYRAHLPGTLQGGNRVSTIVP